MWSLRQQHWCPLGACLRCTAQSPLQPYWIRSCILTRPLSDSLCWYSELQSMITTLFVRLWLVSLAWYFDFRLHHFAQSLAVLCSPSIFDPGCTSGKLRNDWLVLHPAWSSGTSPASAVWTRATSPLCLNPAPVAQESETFWLTVWCGQIVLAQPKSDRRANVVLHQRYKNDFICLMHSSFSRRTSSKTSLQSLYSHLSPLFFSQIFRLGQIKSFNFPSMTSYFSSFWFYRIVDSLSSTWGKWHGMRHLSSDGIREILSLNESLPCHIHVEIHTLEPLY